MLNDRARQILAYIKRFRAEHGSPPTIREIGKQFGIASTNGVRYYLTLLEKAGYIQRRGKISRSIRLPAGQESGASIPVLGRVAAGQPILAEESYDGALDLAGAFGSSQELFALRVRGDSMIDAGILQDDYVIVQRRESALSGEIVVALVDDEATVKYYEPRGDRVELIAANPKYAPIVVTADKSLRLLGVVRGVVRTLGR